MHWWAWRWRSPRLVTLPRDPRAGYSSRYGAVRSNLEQQAVPVCHALFPSEVLRESGSPGLTEMGWPPMAIRGHYGNCQ